MALIPTPEAATFNKSTPGTTDTYYEDGVLKFLGCSVVSFSMTLGLNGTPSSLSVTLVEDLRNGDEFEEPAIPALMSFSCPKGGIAAQILYPDDDADLTPSNFDHTDVPFYFCGLVTSYNRDIKNVGGKLITVQLADLREILSGVQCLASSWALSQNLGIGVPRYDNMKNVIDCFGYYEHGFESERNEYGMEWNKIRDAILASKVTLYNVEIEFVFTGDAFTNTPTWFRISDPIIDLLGLVQTVAKDGGSDLLVISRQVAEGQVVVEFRGIDRKGENRLTKAEIDSFISARSSIVSTASTGTEFRNEPTSPIIVGGPRNSNYIARPSTYNPSMHGRLNENGFIEEYGWFPPTMVGRVFAGASGVEAGAIYPYWGMSPSGEAPLAEPLITLDHWYFGAQTIQASGGLLDFQDFLPWVNIYDQDFTVREVSHIDTFLKDDGDSDSRPFAVYDYSADPQAGWTRGLPLNAEVLHAATVSPDFFFLVYSLHFPSVANHLGLKAINWDKVKADMQSYQLKISGGKEKFVNSLDLSKYYDYPFASRTTVGSELLTTMQKRQFLANFHDLLHQAAIEYAETYMGKQFIVCLPRSEIMHRIWSGRPVPTRPERPEIEYSVADVGYWETVPTEFDGVGSSQEQDDEAQIRERFMAEDGRFYPMAFMDWKPSGNASFYSNGNTRLLFQELPVSDFRPNKIATGNPNWVVMSCSAQQMDKRPDLAVISISPVHFDPYDNIFSDQIAPEMGSRINESELYLQSAFLQYLKMARQLGSDANSVLSGFNVATLKFLADKFIKVFNPAKWLNDSWETFRKARCMDLKAVTIPLDSKWVNYGPWYDPYENNGSGMVNIVVDDSLVPWNFERPPAVSGWDYALNQAGGEKLDRARAQLISIDTAQITVAGFPELGPAWSLDDDAESNITSISTSFGVDGITTTYSLSTYSATPGTYRKSEYDNVSSSRISTRPQLPETRNIPFPKPDGAAGINAFNLRRLPRKTSR
jgi:hypothetical protein